MTELYPNISGFTSGLGGSEYITVDTYAELTANYPATEYGGVTAYVKQSTGIWFINRKNKGWYQSNGTSWEVSSSTLTIRYWDNSTTYSQDQKSIGSDGIIYNSEQSSNVGNDPVSDDGLYWTSAIDFNILNINTAMKEGRFAWDADAGTAQLGMPGGNVNLQLGQEIYLPNRPKNVCGSTITNGKVVYLSGATGSVPEVCLANADTTTAPKTIAVATEDIIDQQRGFYTTFGVVREINTSFGSDGDEVFLDASDGGLTTSKLVHPNFRIRIGYIIRSHATEGVLFVNIQSDAWLKRFQAMQEPTGFDREHSDLIGDFSFDNLTRTLTIEPKAGQDYFTHWIKGREYRNTSADTFQISNVEGIHLVFYDEGTITEYVNPTATQVTETIHEMALISIIYWSVSAQEGIYVGEERHGIIMDSATHSYLHFVDGMRYQSGLGLNTFSVDGSGVLVDVQFGIDIGGVYDEDIFFHILPIASTVGFPIYYKTGTSSWNKTIKAGYSARTFDNTSATNIAWNEYTGGAWQLTELGNNDYCLYHIFATGEKDTPIIAIMGENKYSTIVQARTGAELEIHTLSTEGTLTPETRALGTVIYQANSGYTNDINARIRSTDEGDDYIDWRSTAISRTSLSTDDHNSLSNLQLAQSGVTYGHIDDQAQTIAGIKTFSSFPITPSSAPTTDYQVANKKFVLDNIASGVTASNGLTEVSGDIQLGGTLTSYTTIDGSGNALDIINGTAEIYFDADYVYCQVGSSYTQLQSDRYEINTVDASGTLNVQYRPSFVQFSSNHATFAGFTYGADYSANYTDRSVVDKAYVDAKVISGTTASNGLTEVGDDIQLGGTLASNTTISKDNNSFRVDGYGTSRYESDGNNNYRGFMETSGSPTSGGSSKIGTTNTSSGDGADLTFGSTGGVFTDDINLKGVSYNGDYSSNFTDRSLVDKAFVVDGFVDLTTIQTVAGEKTFSGGVNLTTGNAYEINGVDVLTNTTLGSSVTSSSLTRVGALNSGSITSGFGNIDNGISTLDTGVYTSTVGLGGKSVIKSGSSTAAAYHSILQFQSDSSSDAVDLRMYRGGVSAGDTSLEIYTMQSGSFNVALTIATDQSIAMFGDLNVFSGGDIICQSGDITATSGTVKGTTLRTTGTIVSSDGTAGMTGTFSFVDNLSATRTLTIKDGLITATT